MLHLTTFGGVRVTRDGAPLGGAAAGRRHLALLALLAARGAPGFPREALAAMLWPDRPADAARHSLQQAVYTLRRALGADAVFPAGPALRLDPAALPSDADAFADAVRGREWARAASLHAGPFADGLVLDDADGAARRVDEYRAAFAAAHRHALGALADAAEAAGDGPARLRWLRRLAAADPLAAGSVVRLVAALAEAGEPTAALQEALGYEARVRRELGAPPDPAVAAWVARLRAGGPPPAARAAHGASAGAPALAREAAPPYAPAPGAATDARADRAARALAGRYRLGALVESGGATAVYAAESADGRPVELHVVQPRVAAGVRVGAFAEALGRAARVQAPGVLAPLDAGATGELLWWAAPVRPRPSLRERLRREGPLAVDAAAAVGAAVAAALAAAHAAGVWHGDLRPKHVAVPAGAPPDAPVALVSGFGAADGLAPDPAAAAGDGGSTVVALGAPAYLSPEQLAGGRPDARSDVYALGCVLYEMLAGAPPFGRSGMPLGGAPAAAPPLRSARPRVPPALAELVHACLAPVPADRPRAGEVSNLLDRGRSPAAPGANTSAHPTPRGDATWPTR
jgi:DNA-binding SARP family transcriptional activator